MKHTDGCLLVIRNFFSLKANIRFKIRILQQTIKINNVEKFELNEEYV